MLGWLGLVAGLGRAGTGFWMENRDIRLLPSQLQQLSAIIYSLNMGRCWGWSPVPTLGPAPVMDHGYPGPGWGLLAVVQSHYSPSLIIRPSQYPQCTGEGGG